MKYIALVTNERYYCYSIDSQYGGHFVDSDWKKWVSELEGREYWTFAKAEDVPSHYINRCISSYLCKEFQ